MNLPLTTTRWLFVEMVSTLGSGLISPPPYVWIDVDNTEDSRYAI